MNSAPCQDLWTRTLDRIRSEVGSEDAELWLKPLEGVGLSETALTVRVPNRFYAEGIRERYQKRIEHFLREISGRDIALEFDVSVDLRSVLPPTDPISQSGPQSDFPLGELDTRYTLSSFVVGASNRFAHATATAVARSPGTQYNPLFLYGGVGLGKTHLLHAIGHGVRQQHARARVLYTTAEEFVNDYVKAVKDGRFDEFRGKYRGLDCFLLDDIQFLIGKDRSEEEFLHTFNSLFESRKQIVLSSDRSPKEMAPAERRLISRFLWGPVVDIKPPDLETRIAILEKKAEIERFDMPHDVVVFVASSIKTNIRELEGALIRLKSFASLTGSPLTIDTAKEILRDAISHEVSQPIHIETIQRLVAAKYSLDLRDLKGHQRSASIVLPRQLAMYLACTMTELSYSDVGRHFGGKDHTTVLHARKKIQRLLEEDLVFLSHVNIIRQEIQQVENR